MEADETVQLYLRDVVSSVTRPVKELKGFKPIMLQRGKTPTITFKITPDQFAFWNMAMQQKLNYKYERLRQYSA